MFQNSRENLYKVELNKYLGCGEENIFFYWKGRVALYALLKAMGVGSGDEVIVQGYTCVVVANAILYLGATPIYADIDLDTYNFDIESLKSKISDKTKAIICQNTYGLSSNLETIEAIGKKNGIYTIEDCTHGFGGTYHGKPNGSFCDASFFSSQWNKPFTTGVGGFCVVHDQKLQRNLKKLDKELVKPSFKEKIELWAMYFVRQYIVNDITYWPMIRLYRWLSKKNIVVGSSSGTEVVGIEIPDGYFKAQSNVQFKKGIKSLSRLDATNKVRKESARRYTEYLKSIGKTFVDDKYFDDHIFIRYPLLVNNRKKFRDEAEKAKIILGEWFEQPVYPVYSDLSLWKVKIDELPNGMYVCDRMINLPTDEKNIDKVVRFLEKHKEQII